MSETPKGQEGSAIKRTEVGGASVLSPCESITFENCAELRKAFEDTAGSATVVVLDCRQVKSMDSEALTLLLEWHEKLRAVGATLKLVHLNDVCADILVVTRLIHVLVVCEDISLAVRSG